jgi:hypothetical protein
MPRGRPPRLALAQPNWLETAEEAVTTAVNALQGAIIETKKTKDLERAIEIEGLHARVLQSLYDVRKLRR